MRFDAELRPFQAVLRLAVALIACLGWSCHSGAGSEPELQDAGQVPGIADAGQPATDGSAQLGDAQVDAPDATADAAVLCDLDGNADCNPSLECTNGDMRCHDADTLETCGAGTWAASECAMRCVASALGSSCAPSLPTKHVSGTVRYEARVPNAERTNWSDTLSTLPAQHFTVLSYVGDSLLDATTTDELGAFSLLGPASPGADDHLSIVAAGADKRGRLAFAVADAGHPTSTTALRSPFGRPPDPSVWSWSTALVGFTNDQTVTLVEGVGSGAAHIFETLHAVFAQMESDYAPDETPTVVVWMSPGTSWTCGACMAPSPVALAGQIFEHQVALDGSSRDQGYWSSAVSAHELGHYVMAAYGYPPAEGGPHYTGEPTHPGLAWSEGWATFFSSVQRDTPLYYDKQEATFFWFDLDARSYAPDADLVWPRPVAKQGLEQLIDENEVASMLRDTQQALGALQPMLMALASDRARVPPFERGYTLRTWRNDPSDFKDEGISIPYLADFLDALRCAGGISATELDLITEPAIHYPYLSGSPLCR